MSRSSETHPLHGAKPGIPERRAASQYLRCREDVSVGARGPFRAMYFGGGAAHRVSPPPAVIPNGFTGAIAPASQGRVGAGRGGDQSSDIRFSWVIADGWGGRRLTVGAGILGAGRYVAKHYGAHAREERPRSTHRGRTSRGGRYGPKSIGEKQSGLLRPPIKKIGR